MKNYFHVVKHFPPRTKSYLNDYKYEVLQIASWLAGKSVKRISRVITIYDDQDREWVAVCVSTRYPTKLNQKKISYDGYGNFEDVSARFTKYDKQKFYHK